MRHDTMSDFVDATARHFAIPGVSVGVWASGREHYACHGVTSIENPLPVDQNTLFCLGSISKTYTATALMRLVADGRVELSAPVRRYVPNLALADQQAATQITVLNLLNHTAGLDWDLIVDTGEGDDALANYVAKMAKLRQIAPPGARASYSQAGYSLLGRVIESVVGTPYERAVASLVFEPLALSHSAFLPSEVMTRRFALGHNADEDGTLAVARLWKGPRCRNPGAGIASSVADQLRWARFHLGDGLTEGGICLLPTKLLRQMREPTVTLRASTMGDAIGLSWFLRDVDGIRSIGHGGSGSGQFAELLMVPERNFAIVSLANAGPGGISFNQAVVRWALENYLGVIDRDALPIAYDPGRAQEIVGSYDIDAMTLTISANAASLKLDVRIKPEIRAAAKTQLPPDHSPADFSLLPGDADEYVITSGGLKGQRGFFSRDETGAVVGVDLAGRLFTRVPAFAH